jgi:hypothetical protein
MAGSRGRTLAQTVLLSSECRHVARIGPLATSAGLVLASNGFGLKKLSRFLQGL